MNEVKTIKITDVVTPHVVVAGIVSAEAKISGELGTNIPWVRNYENLYNKPKINEVEINGNRTAEQLYLQGHMDSLTNIELEEMLIE